MEENNVTMQEPTNDELTRMIAKRLGERQRKLKRMQEMERPVHRFRLYGGAIALVAAACVALLLVFAPWRTASVLDDLNIQTPSCEIYRSASPDLAEISRLMEEPDYDAALTATAKALQHSEMELKEFSDVLYEFGDEEMEYEEEQERLMNNELRWTYIYLLVNAERYKEAVKELKIYLKRDKYCEHEEEAKALLRELKKK